MRSNQYRWSPYQVSSGDSGAPSTVGSAPSIGAAPDGRVSESDGGVQAHGREPLGLTRARAEAGAPEQALGLARAERAAVDRDR